MYRLLRWVPFAALLLLSGRRERHAVVVPAGFRWRNQQNLDVGEYNAIRRDGLQRTYCKLLDIDWNPANGAHPVSIVQVPHQWWNYYGPFGPWTDSVEFVPCVFIANRTFEKIGPAEVDELATKVLRKLRQDGPRKIQGVLLDCDWTAGTRERFFRFARRMNDSLTVPVTTTVRLHQFADPVRTGVPPTDRGMLMVYNVGNLQEAGGTNSIFNEADAAPYFAHARPYPLPLDIALPTLSWGAQFRNGRFIGILRDEQIEDAFAWRLLTDEKDGVVQVRNEDNEHMPMLHLGDEIRLERMSPELIQQVAHMAHDAANSDTLAVAFFEVGARCFQQLDTGFVAGIVRSFGSVARPPYWKEPGMPVEGTDPTVVDSAMWFPGDAPTPSKP